MIKQISFFRPDVQDAPFRAEIDMVVKRVLDSNIFVDGEETRKFEEEWSTEVGTKHCVFTSNGTSALEIAVRCCEIDECYIATTPNSFFASSSCMVNPGSDPLFGDTNDQCNLDLENLLHFDAYDAVLSVDLYGNPVNHNGIRLLCNSPSRQSKPYIVDLAQAHYCLYKNECPAKWADVACYSFYSTKTLGCYGEAGCLVTNNDGIAERARSLRNHGLTNQLYRHQYVSGNMRGQEIQAAILRVKLGHKDYYIEERLKLAEQYTKNFSDYPQILLKVNPDCTRLVRYAYTIFHPRRNDLQKYLGWQGIHTNIHYPIPLHLQPAFSYLGYQPGDMPNAERQCNEVLSLPFYAGFDDVDYVSEKVLEFLKKIG
jgi:dTDP-4-amino-4,6-dideoxygalactose transaminase